jgi:hypothetical protein
MIRGIIPKPSRSVAERKAMVDRSHNLPVVRQARELGISRGSVYYLPKPVCAADLAVMRRMDELHLEFPFAGSRMLRDLLRQEGIEIGRQHVAHADEENGDRGDLPPSKHFEAGAGTQDLP